MRITLYYPTDFTYIVFVHCGSTRRDNPGLEIFSSAVQDNNFNNIIIAQCSGPVKSLGPEVLLIHGWRYTTLKGKR